MMKKRSVLLTLVCLLAILLVLPLQAVSAETNGWVTNDDGSYSYYVNGERLTDCVVKLSAYYYGFDDEGIMYENQEFNIYDEELDDWIYYRAKENGPLYANEWYSYTYSDGEKVYFYYGADARAPQGYTVVNGTAYYFDYDGQMYTSGGARDGDGNIYGVNANGTLVKITKNGWTKTTAGEYFYAWNGEVYAERIGSIGGQLYGFRYDGVMLDNNESDYLYDVNREEGGYYRAKPGGVLYQNQWVQPYNNEEYDYNERWYYYGAGGRAVSGHKTIGGKDYYFYSDGQMATDTVIYIDWEECYYAVGSEGSLVKMKENGWTKADDSYFYSVNGTYYEDCVVRIDGKLYSFDNYGCMRADERFSVWDWDSDETYYYYAKANGALCEYEWAQPYNNKEYDYDESWYYYGADGKAANGFTKVGSNWYFFSYEGRMRTDERIHYNNKIYLVDENGYASELRNNAWTYSGGEYYYVQDGELLQYGVYYIDGKYYGFDGDGRMYADEEFEFYNYDLDEWVYYRAHADGSLYAYEWYAEETVEGTDWYYYGTGGVPAEGLTKVGGTWYYFNSYGMAYTDDYITVSGDAVYVFDEDGKGTRYVNGWFRNPYDNQRWKYVNNGELAEGMLKVGNETYYFEYGNMYTDRIAWEYEWETDSYIGYYFDEDGHLVTTPGWLKANGEYYYVENSTGKLVDGWKQDKGVWYYFSPVMASGEVFYDYEYAALYLADENGYTSRINGNGWHQTPNAWYYIENGKVLTDTWKNWNGAWYCFDDTGCMVVDTTYGMDGDWYAFDVNGKMVTNRWFDKRYYAGADGKLYTGMQVIGGTTYLFGGWDGELYTDGIYYYDGNSYLCGADGTVLTANAKNGWNQAGNDWYFVSDGELLQGTTFQYKGDTYYVDNEGKMVTSEVYYCRDAEEGWDYYIFTESGAMHTDGWLYMNGSWYYASPDYKYAYSNGGYHIDGEKYYFYDYKLQIGTFVLWGNIITTDANGAVIEEETLPDGWTYGGDGTVYYYRDGEGYDGWLGDYYISDGRMLFADFIEDDAKLYYLGVNGKYVRGGWYEVYEDRYIYARAGGSLYYDEWLKLGNTYYYFYNQYMAQDGIYTIDGEEHEFAEDGRWLGKVTEEEETSYADGWLKKDGKWYYCQGGSPVWGSYYIDGKWYYFGNYYDEDNAMVTNAVGSNGCYYGNDGVWVKYTGWKLINGEWLYFKTDSRIATGWFQVNGKNYYTEWVHEVLEDGTDVEYPTLLTNCYCVLDEVLYVFNASGEAAAVTADGWYYTEDYGYVYYRNGAFLEDGVYTIDGKQYYFEWKSMVADTVVYNDKDYEYYYCDASGAIVTKQGWYESEDGWVYVAADGTAYAYGIYKIGGKDYCFDNGYWVA